MVSNSSTRQNAKKVADADPMDLMSPTSSSLAVERDTTQTDDDQQSVEYLAEQQDATLSSLEEEIDESEDDMDEEENPLILHSRRRTDSRFTEMSSSSDGTDGPVTPRKLATSRRDALTNGNVTPQRERRRHSTTSSLDLAPNTPPDATTTEPSTPPPANLLSRRNRSVFLKFIYSWTVWFLKVFSCNFCICIMFCVVYGLLFWALAFRLILQKREYNLQQISHPLFLDFSKETPVYDVVVRQKWFLRHAHTKSNVRLGEIRVDFNVYKGWNTTKERFNVDLHMLDRHTQIMWHSKRSVVLPPSITTKRKKKKWKWIPLLTSAEYVEVDETVPVSVDLLIHDDPLELDRINKRISHAHIIRISIDSKDLPIQSSVIHFIPKLSGYAYMTRYHFFITLFLMSVGLFLSVSCCYGTTLVAVCCVSARRKKRAVSTLTEASWSANSLRNIWASPFRSTQGNRQRGIVETRIIDQEEVETPDSAAARAPSIDEEGDELLTGPLTINRLTSDTEEELMSPERRVVVETNVADDNSDDELKSPPSTLRKRLPH